MEQRPSTPQELPHTEKEIGEGTGHEHIPQNENSPPPRPSKVAAYVRMSQQLFSRTISSLKNGSAYSKKRLAIGAITALVLLPILYSFILVPRMSYYKRHQPEFTNFMKYRMHQAQKRRERYTAHYTFIPLKEISPSLLRAVIFAEDSKFYQHNGVDWGSMFTSFKQNIRRHRFAWGGSTLTMQLCKNMFLYPKKTLWRKYLELILTWRMEHALSKPRILELYLNLIEWGPGIFGAENAAQYYFDKSACFLDDEEASLLAAIIMAPRSYKKDKPNPFFEARQQWVYSFMVTGEATEPTADILFDFTIDPELPLGPLFPTDDLSLSVTDDMAELSVTVNMKELIRTMNEQLMTESMTVSGDTNIAVTGALKVIKDHSRKGQGKSSVDR